MSAGPKYEVINRQIDRQTDRLTDRQTDRQKERESSCSVMSAGPKYEVNFKLDFTVTMSSSCFKKFRK